MPESPASIANPQKRYNYKDSGLPSVTVVTVVYNDVDNIEKTLLNVINQEYPNLEYIVIDGGSTDGTADIIKKHKKSIDRWISEKDSGVYDAMNKGIDLATGQYINFMNSNDFFYSPTTILDVFKDCPKDVDFIYGSVIWRKHGKNIPMGVYRPIDEIWKGMPTSHQSFFSKTKLLKENKFCPDKKISSDYESILFHYINERSFFKTDKTIAVVARGGLSDDLFIKFFERWRYARKILNYKIDIYYACLIPFIIVIKYCPPRLSDYIIQKISALKPAKKALTKPTTTLLKKKDG